MIKLNFAFFLFLTIIFMAVFAAIRSSEAAVITVGHGAEYDYQTITAALNAATAGDTITVADGNYCLTAGEVFPLIMKEGVILQRENEAILPHIAGISTESVMEVQNISDLNNTIIDGFLITGGGGKYYNGYRRGGGIFIYNSSITIKNCQLQSNNAHYGGGICCYDSSSPTLTNCTIRGDSAFAGGGIYCDSSSPILTNCTISGNSAYRGGGMYLYYYSSPTLTNCTISGNSAYRGGGMYCEYYSSPTLTNTILWNDLPEEVYKDGTSSPNITYSDVQGGYSGTGNIDADPLFVDYNSDFHLQAGSPCIDAGTNEGAPETDFDGQARPNPNTNIADIGADEYYAGYLTPTPTNTMTPTVIPTSTPTITPIPSYTPTATPTTTAYPKLDLIVHLHGYYKTATHNQLPAEIRFELRDGTSPQTATTLIFDSKIIGLLESDADGHIGPVELIGLTPGDYYLVVRHPSHLPVITNTKLNFAYNQITYADLSHPSSPNFIPCYGGSALYQESDGVLSLHTGNLNGDNFVNVSDFVLWRQSNGTGTFVPNLNSKSSFPEIKEQIIPQSLKPAIDHKNKLYFQLLPSAKSLRPGDTLSIKVVLINDQEINLTGIDASLVISYEQFEDIELISDNLPNLSDLSLGKNWLDYGCCYHYSKISLGDGMRLNPGQNLIYELKMRVREDAKKGKAKIYLAEGFKNLLAGDELIVPESQILVLNIQ